MNRQTYDRHDRKALTGLETAIILIAFIIVASVFSFTVLNLGFQTSQKAGQVVNNGYNQASSSLELDGAIIANGNTSYNKIESIQFLVTVGPGGSPVDLSAGKLVVSYQSPNLYVANAYANDTSGVAIKEVTGTNTSLIKTGEAFQVTVYVTGSTIADTLVPYQQFTIELKPTTGAILTVQGTVPAQIDSVINLSNN